LLFNAFLKDLTMSADVLVVHCGTCSMYTLTPFQSTVRLVSFTDSASNCHFYQLSECDNGTSTAETTDVVCSPCICLSFALAFPGNMKAWHGYHGCSCRNMLKNNFHIMVLVFFRDFQRSYRLNKVDK